MYILTCYFIDLAKHSEYVWLFVLKAHELKCTNLSFFVSGPVIAAWSSNSASWPEWIDKCNQGLAGLSNCI